MKRQNLDSKWRFRFLDESYSQHIPLPSSLLPLPMLLRLSHEDFVHVDLPHDFSIIQKRDPNTPAGASNGFFPGGLGIYEKVIYVPEEWKGKKVMLEFEGVYMNASVYLNNQLVTHHPYGYTSFHCDLTPYLMYGQDNIIRVIVNNSALPNTRWYSGSGIYRHVWLMIGESVHITPWGVYVTTPKVSHDSSIVCIRTTVENITDKSQDITIRSTLMDGDNVVAKDDVKLSVPPRGTAETQQELTVSNAKLWSIENPYLYTLRSEVIKDEEAIDSAETSVGIRSISIDPQKGFCLNDVPIKLRGGCVHHDCGLLGAAAYDRAEERKVELLKANGFNAVRCAHNPPSPAFLDACDRLGMLVINEAFDCWRESKKPNDYSLYFEDWWQKDLASMVLRDRNHPCVIMWSTGNEIIERDGRSDGYAYARKLADFIRSLDNTRPITNALCRLWDDTAVRTLKAKLGDLPEDYDVWGEVTKEFVEPLDVVGYNYLLDRYQSDGEKFPGRIICGTESFPMQVFDIWNTIENLPYVIGDYVIGDFVWTALDYLGEAGIGYVWYKDGKGFPKPGKYPWHQAYCGDIDICGFKRPQSYYRDCVWGIAKKPYIAVYKPERYGKEFEISWWGWPDVVSSWTWPGFEGKPTKVDVYSTDAEVEIVLNGKSLGRKPAGKANRYMASFEVVYEPGTLEAVGYDEKGRETSRTILKTAGKPAAIRLTPDRRVLKAKFGDLSYVTVEVVDAEGNVVHNADTNIYFTASGVGSILAVGNGNPVSEEMYVGNQRKVYYGRAMVVVRANGEPGNIVLSASAEGIPTAQVVIEVK